MLIIDGYIVRYSRHNYFYMEDELREAMMEYKIVGGLKPCFNGEVVAENDYSGNAFADPHMETTEEDVAMGYKAAGDEIAKAWRDFNGYLKRHPEVWQALADKLWDGFVDYKDVPFGDKEVWHE